MKSAVFQITNNCNQDCKFCLIDKKNKNELNLKQKIDAINKLKKLGVKTIAISGGEPLTDKGFVSVVNHCKHVGIKVIVQTNGVLINKEILTKIKDKVFGVEVALEGLKNEHNYLTSSKNFDKVVQNIKLATKHTFVFTNFTITKANMHCLKPYVKLVNELKVFVANFTKLYMKGNAKINFFLEPSQEEYKSFLKTLANIKSKTILNVQPGFSKQFLDECKVKEYSLCPLGKEITLNPYGEVLQCPGMCVSKT
ncbi:radical SAM protein [Candidatus Woesearchaeota archaeon]|nr:MAG: radical SAM protein [Candidatus Woesearchaeota archaeon]